MNKDEFMSAIDAKKIVARFDPEPERLTVDGRITKDIRRAVMALKDELLEFACGECGLIDGDPAYDKNGIPFCTRHYHRIGLLWCELCEERTKLTSMSDCLVCVAQQVIEETLASQGGLFMVEIGSMNGKDKEVNNTIKDGTRTTNR